MSMKVTPRIAVITHEFPSATNPTVGPALYETARALGRHCDVRVFCLKPKYPSWSVLQPRTFRADTTEQSHVPGVDVSYLGFPALPWISRPANSWLCQRTAQRTIADWKPDLILAYFLYPQGCAAVSIGRTLGVPVILGTLGSDLLRLPNRLARLQVANSLRHAAAIIGVSNHLIRAAVEMGASPGRAFTIRNGCDKTVFHPLDRKTVRQKLGVSADRKLILFIGRLVELKGVGDLLHALAVLRSQGQIADLACIGDGPMLETWRQKARLLSIQDQVTFLGPKPTTEVAQWLGASDALCLPSYSEGSPSVLLEALSSGRPVVATNVGGIPDMVSAETGTLVAPGSPKLLATAIQTVLEKTWDSDLIRAQSARAWTDVGREVFELCMAVWSGRPFVEPGVPV